MSASTPSFLSTIRALFSSRKYLVFVVTLAVAIASRLGVQLDPVIVLGVLLFGGALMGFIAWEDVAAKSNNVLAPFDDEDLDDAPAVEVKSLAGKLHDTEAELRQAQEENGRLRELHAALPGPKLAHHHRERRWHDNDEGSTVVRGRARARRRDRWREHDVQDVGGRRRHAARGQVGDRQRRDGVQRHPHRRRVIDRLLRGACLTLAAVLFVRWLVRKPEQP